jgi:hypothetical protein
MDMRAPESLLPSGVYDGCVHGFSQRGKNARRRSGVIFRRMEMRVRDRYAGSDPI